MSATSDTGVADVTATYCTRCGKLPDEAVRFLLYHGENDAAHLERWLQALEACFRGDAAIASATPWCNAGEVAAWPLLGKGTELRKAMGPGTSPTPNAIFNDLATWEKIPFVYTPQNRRMTADMVRLAEEPAKLSRLARVLDDELAHDLAFAVERGKIAANGGDENPRIRLDQVEPGLSVPLPAEALAECLGRHADALARGAAETALEWVRSGKGPVMRA